MLTRAFGCLRPAVFVLLFATPASAQTVVGTVTHVADGTPVVGAFVALIADGTGGQAAAALTDGTGRYAMRVPTPGRYRLRVEFIGLESGDSGPLTIEAGQTVRRDFTLGRTAIALEGIEAEAETRCRVRPEEGLAVARVWEEARKALAVAEWTGGEGAYRFRTVRYERVIDLETGRVTEEQRRARSGFFQQPFTSRSAERLAAEGFLAATDSGTFLFAPDAHVLLSDPFLDTHCFRIAGGQEDETAAMIGLAFRPVAGRDLPEVSGELWLDRETAALSHLEYRYVNLPYEIPTDRLGGRVDFRRMPNGAWIVESWSLRTPMIGLQYDPFDVGRRRRVLTAIKEDGGDVVEARAPGGETVLEREGAVLTGVVHDSTTGAPLAGAEVFLSGTSHTATTGADGRFTMDGLPEGRYAVGFLHGRLDSLGILPSPVGVALAEGEPASVALVIPSGTTLLAAECGGVAVDTMNAAAGVSRAELAELHRGTATIVGTVRDAVSGRPLSNARVQLAWSRFATQLDRGAVREEARTVEVTSDGSGRFRACDLPEAIPIRVRATVRDRTSERVTVRVPDGQVRRVELRVGSTDGADVPDTTVDDGWAAPSSVPGAWRGRR